MIFNCDYQMLSLELGGCSRHTTELAKCANWAHAPWWHSCSSVRVSVLESLMLICLIYWHWLSLVQILFPLNGFNPLIVGSDSCFVLLSRHGWRVVNQFNSQGAELVGQPAHTIPRILESCGRGAGGPR